MNARALGSGCAIRVRLEAIVMEGLAAAGIADATVEKVTDYANSAATGIVSTPGLVVGGGPVQGRDPVTDGVATLLLAARGAPA